MLLHQGSAGIGGTAVDIEIQAQNLEHTRDVLLGLIAEHTGQPLERIAQDSLRDRWFTAAEAQGVRTGRPRGHHASTTSGPAADRRSALATVLGSPAGRAGAAR